MQCRRGSCGSRPPLPHAPRPFPGRQRGASRGQRARVPGRPACAAGACAAGRPSDKPRGPWETCVCARCVPVCVHVCACTRAHVRTRSWCRMHRVRARLCVHTQHRREYRRGGGAGWVDTAQEASFASIWSSAAKFQVSPVVAGRELLGAVRTPHLCRACVEGEEARALAGIQEGTLKACGWGRQRRQLQVGVLCGLGKSLPALHPHFPHTA